MSLNHISIIYYEEFKMQQIQLLTELTMFDMYKSNNELFNLKQYVLNHKKMYKQYIEQIFYGHVLNHLNSTKTVLISRNGQIVEDIILKIEFVSHVSIPELTEILESIELVIGGQRIEKISNYQILIAMKLLNLTTQMIGNVLYLPLPFDLLNANNVLAIYAISYQEVKVNIKLVSSFLNLCEQKIVTDITTRVGYLISTQIKSDQKVKYNDNYCLPDINLKSNLKSNLKTCLIQKYNYFQSDLHLFDLTNPRIQVKLNLNHATKYIFFYFTDPNQKLITHNLLKHVRLQFNGFDANDDTYSDLLYNSQKIMNLSGIYCLLSDDGPLHDYNSQTIDLSNIDNMTVIMNRINNLPTDLIDQKINIHVCALSYNLLIYQKIETSYLCGSFWRLN